LIKNGTTFLGMDADTAKVATIILVGALMIIYVTVGGMKGTTYVQIVKAFMLMSGALLMTVLVLAHYRFNLSNLLGDAAAQSGKGDAFLEPGLRYGVEKATAVETFYSKMDLFSLGLALVLGTAGLPHILTRFYTVPTSRIARKSVLWAIAIIGTFYLLTLALGFGAAALVGSKAITAQDKAGNTAAPQLAQALGVDYLGGATGGAVLLAVIAAVAFATILAVVAGLTLASSSSLAHDFYANVIRRGTASERDEVRVARIAALVIGAIAIALSIFAQSLNVAFLVALAFAVAASANLPAILYSLFWHRFNTSGALWAIYGGLISAVLLVFFSPVVSGSPTAMFPNSDWHWFPLSNPGIISIPIGFLCGWIGTVLSKEDDSEKYAELEVRSLTGYGAH
jgi:cation/acetate symporter